MVKKDKSKKSKTDDLSLFYNVSEKATKLNEEYYEVYDRLVKYVVKNEPNTNKLNIIVERAIDDLLLSQASGFVAKAHVGNDFKAYLKKVEKTINFQKEAIKQRDNDYEKFTISSIWEIGMMFIVLLFIRNVITNMYIINFSIDALIGVVAFYLGLSNFWSKYRIFKRYEFSMNFIYLDIITFGLCIFVKFITPIEYGNFDVTFLFLVCAYLIPKKKIRKMFENVA